MENPDTTWREGENIKNPSDAKTLRKKNKKLQLLPTKARGLDFDRWYKRRYILCKKNDWLKIYPFYKLKRMLQNSGGGDNRQ